MTKHKAPTKRRGGFGRFVRAHRVRLGISLTRLARSMEFDQGVLSKIERGIRRAPQIVPYVQRIAASLGFEPSSNEYRELMELAYKERFGERRMGIGQIGTLGAPHEATSARALSGLPAEFTAPDSPAGEYYRSIGIPVGHELKEARSPNGPPTKGPFVITLGATPKTEIGSAAAPAVPRQSSASLQALLLCGLAQLGVRIFHFEQKPAEAAAELEIETLDGRRYTITIMEKGGGATES